MKRQFIFCIALVAVMASCVKQPHIYRILTEEEAAAIPYQMGQKVDFLDQDGDTICFTVVNDTSYVTFDDHNSFYYPSSRTSFEPLPYYYMREVVLQSQPEDSCLLRCRVAPFKNVTITFEQQRPGNSYNGVLYYYWHIVLDHTLPLNDLDTTSFTIGETTYEHVYVDQGTNTTNYNSISYAWYYSEQIGLLTVKQGERSLTLIP